jgi:uncharacterized membrane protein YkoI
MTNTKKWIAGAAVATILAGGIGGVAVANGGGDNGDDHPITGEAYDKASAAALKATGGGKVTDTEVGDEESYYEVEVTLDDGSQVDVQLDRDLNVVDQMADSENDE